MFKGYNGSGGFGNDTLRPQPLRIDESMAAARNSLTRAYGLYQHYQQNGQPEDRDTLKNKILTEVTFARTFYIKLQNDIRENPLETAGYQPRISELEHRIDEFIGTLRADGIVYEDMLLGSREYGDAYSQGRF
jgi:hypothetical protein